MTLPKQFSTWRSSKSVKLPVMNKSKRMVGIVSLGDVSHSAPDGLLVEYMKSVSAHHH